MKIFYYYDKRGEKVNRPPGYCKLLGKNKIKQKSRPTLHSAGRPVFRLWKFCIHGNISPLAMQESINHQKFNLKFNQLL